MAASCRFWSKLYFPLESKLAVRYAATIFCKRAMVFSCPGISTLPPIWKFGSLIKPPSRFRSPTVTVEAHIRFCWPDCTKILGSTGALWRWWGRGGVWRRVVPTRARGSSLPTMTNGGASNPASAMPRICASVWGWRACVSTPERRDRLWLLNAFAVALLTLLGAAGEALDCEPAPQIQHREAQNSFPVPAGLHALRTDTDDAGSKAPSVNRVLRKYAAGTSSFCWPLMAHFENERIHESVVRVH